MTKTHLVIQYLNRMEIPLDLKLQLMTLLYLVHNYPHIQVNAIRVRYLLRNSMWSIGYESVCIPPFSGTVFTPPSISSFTSHRNLFQIILIAKKGLLQVSFQSESLLSHCNLSQSESFPLGSHNSSPSWWPLCASLPLIQLWRGGKSPMAATGPRL